MEFKDLLLLVIGIAVFCGGVKGFWIGAPLLIEGISQTTRVMLAVIIGFAVGQQGYHIFLVGFATFLIWAFPFSALRSQWQRWRHRESKIQESGKWLNLFAHAVHPLAARLENKRGYAIVDWLAIMNLVATISGTAILYFEMRLV